MGYLKPNYVCTYIKCMIYKQWRYHFKRTKHIFQQSVKWFPVLLSNSNNSTIQYSLLILKWFFALLYNTNLICYQSESEWFGSNGSEGVLHIPPHSRIGYSPSEFLASYPGNMLVGGLNPLQWCNRSTLQPQLTEQRHFWRFVHRNTYFCLANIFVKLLFKVVENQIN